MLKWLSITPQWQNTWLISWLCQKSTYPSYWHAYRTNIQLKVDLVGKKMISISKEKFQRWRGHGARWQTLWEAGVRTEVPRTADNPLYRGLAYSLARMPEAYDSGDNLVINLYEGEAGFRTSWQKPIFFHVCQPACREDMDMVSGYFFLIDVYEYSCLPSIL